MRTAGAAQGCTSPLSALGVLSVCLIFTIYSIRFKSYTMWVQNNISGYTLQDDLEIV